MQSREAARIHRKKRIKAKIKGTAKTPRLCVFRSAVAIYAQLIDDEAGKTLVAFDSRMLKGKEFNIEKSFKTGEELAKIAGTKGIKQAVFDRGGYKYHGKVKALAEGARKGGLKF